MLQKLICLIISIVLSPITALILLICFLYRLIVIIILKIQLGNEFIELLEGTDAIWAIEDQSKSVINILSLIQINNVEEFINKLKNKIKDIIQNENYKKLTYFREEKYGFYFWKRNNFDIHEYINYLPKIKSCQHDNINKQEVLTIIADCSNKSLPKNHTSNWEILIGTQKFENNIPVLFRFHHSLGDGTSLLKLLYLTSDESEEKDTVQQTKIQIVLLKFISLFRTIISIIFMPGLLLHLFITKTIDDNLIHGHDLSGNKILAWISEDKDFPILNRIKSMKCKLSGMYFQDFILAALSEAFYMFFSQKSSEIPESITAVLIERLEKMAHSTFFNYRSSERSRLTNRFSLGLLKLPIFPYPAKDLGTGNDYRTFDRLQEVNRKTKFLKTRSFDFQVHYWLLNEISTILPCSILRPLLKSAHSTMVISNILGPNEISLCDGHLIKNLIFWIPHKGLTGVGVSVFSYGGKLEIGLNVDKTLITCYKDVDKLLQNFLIILRNLYNDLNEMDFVKTCTYSESTLV